MHALNFKDHNKRFWDTVGKEWLLDIALFPFAVSSPILGLIIDAQPIQFGTEMEYLMFKQRYTLY